MYRLGNYFRDKALCYQPDFNWTFAKTEKNVLQY